MAACVLGIAQGWRPGIAVAEPAPPRDPAALLMTINGHPVRQGDLDSLLQIHYGPRFTKLTAEEQETLRINRDSDTRSQLTDRVLLVTAARAAGIAATRDEVEAQIENVKQMLPPELTFDGYLTGMGVAAATFFQHAEDQVLIDKLSAKRTAEIAEPTAEEVEVYYRQNPQYFARKERARVSHVLVSTLDAITDEQRAARRAEAEVVRRRLLAEGPEAFARIAREVSNCPSKEQGGDLGVVEKGTMVAAFDDAAFSQELGTVGRVVRTPKGYHVLKVTERLPAEQVSLDDARADIEAMLLFRAREQVMEGYLQTLRLSAKVAMPEPAPAE